MTMSPVITTLANSDSDFTDVGPRAECTGRQTNLAGHV